MIRFIIHITKEKEGFISMVLSTKTRKCFTIKTRNVFDVLDQLIKTFGISANNIYWHYDILEIGILRYDYNENITQETLENLEK